MTENTATKQQPPPAWVEALDRAEADLAAGRVYDSAAVRQRLQDSIKRMQAEADTKAAQPG